MSRFVPPAVKTLTISHGDTLTVKQRLNTGEQRAAFARMSMATANGDLKVNPLEMGIGLVVAYLVDWSLVDDHGRLVVIRDQPPEVVQAAVDALDPESFAEIKAAIQAHDAGVLEAREQEKNDQDGANGSSVISPSPGSVTGDTSGSSSSTPTSTTCSSRN